MDDFFKQISKKGLSGTALIEIGKALLAFTNIITALAIINIIYKEENPLISSIILLILFIMLYYIGYKIIKKGENHV